MKKTIFIICFIFLSCSSSLKYLNKFDGLNGKPKKVELTKYTVEYEDSIPTESMAFKFVDFYDSKGRKTKTSMFNSEGLPSSGGIYYSYDTSGNRTEFLLRNKDSIVTVENQYKYDSYGNEIERVYISGDRKVTTKRIYDRKNKTVRIIGKNSDGSFKEDAVQKHDDQWNKTELVTYNSKGDQENRIEFFYDEKGNEIQTKWYNSENELYEYYNSTYNFKNERIRIEKYRMSDGEPKLVDDTKTTHEYDKEGNCIEERLTQNGNTTWITTRKYEYR